ncbi:MAG: ABC-2 transporter permease [Lachnospiraceae bacterium]|nr:ABC-2 transporter permease [Lachnospiraceae bacterium]
MKGLLIKDCRLLLQQKNFIILLFLCTIFLFTMAEEPSFIIAYVTLLMVMMFLGTVSYDEFDNGYSFLFTLPISRKEYVLEKYVLCVCASLGAGIVATIACLAGAFVRQNDIEVQTLIVGAACILAVSAGILAVMLPIILKYGPDKLRTISFVIAGVIVACGMLLSKLQIPEGSTIDLAGIMKFIETLGTVGIVVIVALIGIAALIVSFLISVKIMEKKEF